MEDIRGVEIEVGDTVLVIAMMCMNYDIVKVESVDKDKVTYYLEDILYNTYDDTNILILPEDYLEV